MVGANGAGKSTLMSIAAGALRPSSGAVRLAGLDPYGGQRAEALRQVALMPQLLTMPKNMTAIDVVRYLTWMRGIGVSESRKLADEALEQVGLAPRAKIKVGKLSGGMQRRVALAQALAAGADVVLLDEPSTGLDPKQRRVMVDLISALEGTVLLSSHVMEDVVEVAERVIVLDAGRVVFQGSVSELCALAPLGTASHRAAEAAFIRLINGGSDD